MAPKQGPSARRGPASLINDLEGSGPGQLSRRAVLGLLGVAGAGLATGCQIDTGDAGAGGGGGGKSDPRAIEFPDYDTELPSGDVTFRWVDSGDLKSVWERSVLDAFAKKHDNISTQYDGSGWDNVNQVVPLGIRNDSAHDVFALPQEVAPQVAVNQGWVQPIEELIPDFDTWVAGFPENALVPGVNLFNDKLYSWPISSSRRLTYMAMYDLANMKAAGYDDPVNQITSWDEVTTALTDVTKTGKVGLMLGGSDGLAGVLGYLANTAGWGGSGGDDMLGGFDLEAGEYSYSADEMVQAWEFLSKLIKDKLVVPGYLTLLAADARAQMPAGGAGMIYNGPWDIPAWKETAPDWKYSIGRMQSPSGDDYVLNFQEGANSSWVYAKTKIPNAVGQVIAYMGSREGQKMMVILSEGNLQSLQPEANKAAEEAVKLDDKAQDANALARDLMRVSPRPELKNPDVAQVTLELKPVTPTFLDILQGLVTGDLSDAKKEFSKYDAKLEAALEDALAAAKKKGSSATRDDFAFSNWDRTKDYTIEMYESA